MLKINRYIDIDTVEREKKKDYIDRHSPFIETEDKITLKQKTKIKVRVGKEYEHPDDFDHYISNISLFNGETLLARADFVPGTLGGQDNKGQVEVDFYIVPSTKKLNLIAQAYCTKHGLWESTSVTVQTIEA